MSVLVKKLHPDAKVPTLVHHGDVGYDLYLLGDHQLLPGERRDLPTGIAIAMENRIYGRITGRSSSTRRGLYVAEGIIDSGYRGELFAYAVNQSNEYLELHHHDRIAQLVFAWAVRPVVIDAMEKELPPSDRGARGLGSTGV